MGKVSLKDELAGMLNPQPQERDPEALEDAFSDREDSSEEENDTLGREHYVDVSESKLRSKQAPQLDPKFKGRKTSRQELFNSGSLNSQSSSPSEEEDSEEDEDDAVSEDHENFSGSEASSISEENEDDDQSSAIPEKDMDRLKKIINGEKKLSDQIRTSALEDMKKGLALKEQMRFYDNVLDTRIRLQKGCSQLLSSSNQLQGDKVEARDGLVSFLQQTLQLRKNLLIDSGVEILDSRSKRKENPVSLEEIALEMNNLDDSLNEWKNDTLTKWHNRVQAVQGISQSNKFKALNQSIVQQIENSMINKKDLVERTRIDHSDPNNKTFNPEIYNDTDFYQSLLKDFINSRMADSTRDGTVRWMATKKQKQKKENVDTKASKGRKIRYHVHDKLQNFMAPIEVTVWPDEQTEDLFSSLLGQQLDLSETANDTNTSNFVEKDDELISSNDGFSLFG
ncbi:Protein bfr2 [Schizosaccharomyces pombe]